MKLSGIVKFALLGSEVHFVSEVIFDSEVLPDGKVINEIHLRWMKSDESDEVAER